MHNPSVLRAALFGLALLTAAFFLQGCGDPAAADAAVEPTGPPKVKLTNKTRTDIDGTVASASMPLYFGKVERGESKTLSHAQLTLPPKIELNWTDHRGDRHFATVNVRRTLGKHYTGSIHITLKGRGEATVTKTN